MNPINSTNCVNHVNQINHISWFAIWTRYRHEDLVREQLEQKEFETFLPKVQALSKRKDRRKMIQKPLFPGYLFARTELNPGNYLKIIKCQGVVRVLGYREDYKAFVSDDVIESIRRMVRGEAPVNVHPTVIKGDSVRIIGGPLDGCVGTVIEIRGDRHLVVAVELLSRSVSVVLSPGTTVLPTYH